MTRDDYGLLLQLRTLLLRALRRGVHLSLGVQWFLGCPVAIFGGRFLASVCSHHYTYNSNLQFHFINLLQAFSCFKNFKTCICLLQTFLLTNLPDVQYCTSKKDNLFVAHRLARGWRHYNTGPSTPQNSTARNIQTGTLFLDFIPNLKLYHEKVMPRSVLLHSFILKAFHSRKGPLFNCIERCFIH